MNENSPFQDWLEANTQGWAFSQEIRMWMAKAYEGGYVDGNQSAVEAKVSKFIDAHTKPWVGLTFDDETECLAAGNAHGWKGVMKKTEEKLKEKNT